MLSIRHDPFPFEAVRDLLGLVRALYTALRLRGGSPEQLQSIAEVGSDLRQALGLAKVYRPGTLGFSSAWTRAERATSRLGELVDVLLPAEPIVTAAVWRAKRGMTSQGRKRG